MAQQRKKEQPVLTTAVGTLVFPYLTKPRAFKDSPTKLAYDTSFLLDGADADELIARIEAWRKEAQEQTKFTPGDPPYGEHTDKEKNVIPGVTKFKFKMRTDIELKDGTVWSPKPNLVDAAGAPLVGRVSIGNGSRARIKYQPFLTAGGVKKSWVVLQPLVVQIIDLKGGASEYGMDAYEGGGYVQGASAPVATDGGEAPTSGREF